MLEKIKNILNQANPEYEVIYEEAHMMNIKVDELQPSDSFVYIEEFLRGQYLQEKYIKAKVLQMQLYFCKFTEMQNDADARQLLRDQIEAEIVLPFMDKYEKSNLFGAVGKWNIYYPLPRWDANEVSIMLEFECKMQIC